MMIGLNTEEFADSLNDIMLLISRMVSKKGQRVLKLSGQNAVDTNDDSLRGSDKAMAVHSLIFQQR